MEADTFISPEGGASNLTHEEVTSLINATAVVLATLCADVDGSRDILEVSTLETANIISEMLSGDERGVTTDDINTVLTDFEVVNQLSIAILDGVGSNQALMPLIVSAQKARSQRMISGEELLLLPILVILLKLKEVKIGDNRISFYDVNNSILNIVKKFLG